MDSIRLVKIIAAGCFLATTFALFAVHEVPARAYEASVYAGVPPYAWVLLGISSVGGLLIAVMQLLDGSKQSRLWLAGYAIVVLNTTVILSLHILRGYAPLNLEGDIGNHVLWVERILQSGHVHFLDYYPPAHIYVAQLSQITALPAETWFQYAPVVLTLFFILSIFALAKLVLCTKGEIGLAAIAGIIPLSGYYLILTPQHVSFYMLPFIIFCIISALSTKKFEIRAIITIIIVVFTAILHPLLPVGLILFVVGYVAFQSFHSKRKGASIGYRGLWICLAVAALTLISYLVWFSQFREFIPGLLALFDRFNSNQSYVSGSLAQAATAEAYGYNIWIQFLKVYGGMATYIALFVITFFLLLKFAKGEHYQELRAVFGGSLVIVFFVLIMFTTKLVSPFRVMAYFLALCSLFVGFTFFRFTAWSARFAKYGRMLSLLMICMVFAATLLSSFSAVYPSPFIRQPTSQTTVAEIEGMRWFLNEKNHTTYVATFLLQPPTFQFASSNLEPDAPATYGYSYGAITALPFHLGYSTNSTLAETVGAMPDIAGRLHQDKYVVLTEKAKEFYVDVLPEVASARFLPQDFKHMDNDISLDKIYSNGGLDTWYLHARARATT